MRILLCLLLALLAACTDERGQGRPRADGSTSGGDAAASRDATEVPLDAGPGDTGAPDAGAPDAAPEDASASDAEAADAGAGDAAAADAGAGDAAAADAAPADAAAPDAAAIDAGPALGCGAGIAQRVAGLRTSMSFSTELDAHAVAAAPGGAVTIGGSLSGRETFGAGTPQQVMLQGSQIGSPVVLRYDASGAFSWGRVFSTSSGSLSGIGAAADGSIVVTGWFEGTLVVDAGLPTEQRLTGPGSQDGYDLFVSRLDPSGAVLWIRTAGGGAFDFPGAITVAPDGSSVVAGRYGDFTNPNTITFDGTHTLTSMGRWEELFIAAYDPQGAVRWVRQAGSPGRDDFVNGMTRLPDGSVVLTGALDPGMAVFGGGSRPDRTLTVGGSSGYYLAKYSAGGDLDWVETANGDAFGSAVASFGDTIAAAVTGAQGATFDPGTPSARSLASSARAIALYASSGELLSLTPVMNNVSIGGVGAIAAAPDGTIALAGNYYSQATFYTTSGDVTLMPQGWDDAFVACLPPGGSGLAWIRQGRGVLQEYGRDVTIDGQGRIVAAGWTRDGMTFESGNGTTVPVMPGGNGFYVVIGR